MSEAVIASELTHSADNASEVRAVATKWTG